MKKGLAIIGLVIVLLFAWVVPVAACDTGSGSGGGSGQNTTCWGTSFFYKIGEGTVTAKLISADKKEVGTVTVWELDGELYVKYDVFEGWTLTETALFVGRGSSTDKAESQIPTDRKGNYNPAKFGDNIHEGLSEDTDLFTLIEKNLGTGWGKNKGNWLCIAAYAELLNEDDSTVTAWGDLLPVSAWKLPRKPVTVTITNTESPGVLSTAFDLELSDVGKGYSISNITYPGWCGDYWDLIDPLTEYSVKVYSSLNLKGVPDYLTDNISWNMINYVLNHCAPDTDQYEIQNAIWYLTNGEINWPPDDTIAQNIVDDALANGGNFIPGAGQVAALILDPGESIQPLIIELYAPTISCKESSCHTSCNPNWKPSQTWQSNCSNWQPYHPYSWNNNCYSNMGWGHVSNICNWGR